MKKHFRFVLDWKRGKEAFKGAFYAFGVLSFIPFLSAIIIQKIDFFNMGFGLLSAGLIIGLISCFIVATYNGYWEEIK